MPRSTGFGNCRELGPRDYPVLANALGDSPETVIPVHKLKRGLCRAWVAGDPGNFDAAVIQGYDLPEEPAVFGRDANIIWDLLKEIPGWNSPDFAPEVAPSIGALIQKQMGVSVRYYGGICHVMANPAPRINNDAVRQLTLADLSLLETTRVGPWAGGYESPRELLLNGVVACAIVGGEIVSVAHTYARSVRYADIGVRTFEEWRNRGFATAAAAVVARCVQQVGQTPVWGAGEDNAASLRVAEKLGFREVSRRTYVIVEGRSRDRTAGPQG